MIKKILLLCILQCFFIGFSQHLKPIPQKISEYHDQGESFVRYDLFEINKASGKMAVYKRAATDITVLNINQTELKKIIKDQPHLIEISFPFDGNKQITVELYKNQIFTNDFKVTTSKGQIVQYTPGVYYQGIVKGDQNSVVAFSFFNDDIVGVASTQELGNIVLGKVKNTEDFVSYSESKLTGANPFICGADELKENYDQKIPYNSQTAGKTLTQNCVRVYYEICYQPYLNNNSNTNTVTNWLTAIHNNIATLYNNDEIRIALSEIYIWTTQDPYNGTPGGNLNSFRINRPTFNGDLAHLVNAPATTSIAYLNSLCTGNKYAYSGISQTYNNVPVYSWTIQAMTHEMGHSLGSPHTHSCAWNGNNTPIDWCGPTAIPSIIVSEALTCTSNVLPASGTIMSYCHLMPGIGINFSNGFGPQPAALIRNTVDSKSCLGTNCITSCGMPVTAVNFTNATQNSINVVLTDIVSNAWKYKVTGMDGTVITTGNTNSHTFTITGLQPATYYKLYVGTSCSLPNVYQSPVLFLTDGNWCDGIQFTDSGGTSTTYGNGENIVKTFYPVSGAALTLTFTELALEQDYDFLYVYNGPSTASPLFSNGSLTGNTLPGAFTSTDATGAVTVKFVSDPAITENGWKANFSCTVLGIEEAGTKDTTVGIYPNPAKNIIIISSVENLKSYKIFDEAGRLVLSSSSLKGNKLEVNLSSIQAGNYVVSIETDKQTVNKKLIKH
ncbi:T9SS type A sorting domain-containing protein [Chryseobacterium populi]|uniref:CUB domain Reprolysin (M12B) family zinc metalloprotease n=1 Tax=Chryseobacterium populi TaxID=1144316 RepID=J2JI02_9FLAO|nr:T9SS type A sorting domain-containing protein [Chryseobacterium populi]EJL67520.1 CUB domain Reprolysin (M12B) family zinc metalloprotease [Chryseobacterium populi]